MSGMDKVKGKLHEMKGEGKERMGSASGDNQAHAEGRAEHMKGGLKQTGEKLKDMFKH